MRWPILARGLADDFHAAGPDFDEADAAISAAALRHWQARYYLVARRGQQM